MFVIYVRYYFKNFIDVVLFYFFSEYYKVYIIVIFFLEVKKRVFKDLEV